MTKRWIKGIVAGYYPRKAGGCHLVIETESGEFKWEELTEQEMLDACTQNEVWAEDINGHGITLTRVEDISVVVLSAGKIDEQVPKNA